MTAIKKHKHKIQLYYGYTAVGMIAITMLYLFYLIIFPLKVADIELPVMNQTIYQAGDNLDYCVSLVKYKDYPATVTIQLLDGYIYHLVTFESNVSADSMTVCHNDIKIPVDAQTDEYRLRITYTYNINPIHKIVIVNESEPFIIYAN